MKDIIKYIKNKHKNISMEDKTNIIKIIVNSFDDEEIKNIETDTIDVLRNVLKIYEDSKDKEKEYILNAIKECSAKGHQFLRWNVCLITREVLVWESGQKSLIEVKEHTYKRKCKKCRYIEETKEMPEEILKKQEEKNRKIEELENKLNDLKKEI